MTCAFDEALREARLDDKTAIDWAENYFRQHNRWPSRRWRLEGTQSGNSRLLSEKEARKAHKKYGGALVELVPDRWHYRDLCFRDERECVLPPTKKGSKR